MTLSDIYRCPSHDRECPFDRVDYVYDPLRRESRVRGTSGDRVTDVTLTDLEVYERTKQHLAAAHGGNEDEATRQHAYLHVAVAALMD